MTRVYLPILTKDFGRENNIVFITNSKKYTEKLTSAKEHELIYWRTKNAYAIKIRIV